MLVCRHTHSTQPCFSSLFYLYTNFSKTKPWLTWIHCPVTIQDLEENSPRFHRAARCTVKECPTPWNTSPERLFATVPGPFPEHNFTNPILWNGAGDISPGGQPRTDGQCAFFSPSTRADHPLTTPVLHCLGESGQVRSMPQVPMFDSGSTGASRASKMPPPSGLQDTGTEFVVLLCGAGMEEPKYVLLILSFFECKWISGFSLQTFLRHCWLLHTLSGIIKLIVSFFPRDVWG